MLLGVWWDIMNIKHRTHNTHITYIAYTCIHTNRHALYEYVINKYYKDILTISNF